MTTPPCCAPGSKKFGGNCFLAVGEGYFNSFISREEDLSYDVNRLYIPPIESWNNYGLSGVGKMWPGSIVAMRTVDGRTPEACKKDGVPLIESAFWLSTNHETH